MSKISMEEKRGRMLNFVKQLSFSISQQTRFSFTQQLSKFMVRWSANALSCRGIFLEEDLIVESKQKPNVYEYTERGKKFTPKQLVDFLIAKIDGDTNYLATYTVDIVPGTIGEPVPEAEELESNATEAEEEEESIDEIASKIGIVRRQAQVATIEPITEIEPAQEVLELDEVEWSIIRLALNKFIEAGEDDLYGQLATRIIEKIK